MSDNHKILNKILEIFTGVGWVRNKARKLPAMKNTVSVADFGVCVM